MGGELAPPGEEGVEVYEVVEPRRRGKGGGLDSAGTRTRTDADGRDVVRQAQRDAGTGKNGRRERRIWQTIPVFGIHRQ